LPPYCFDFERVNPPKETKETILGSNPGNPSSWLREMMQLADLVKNYDLFLSADEVNMKFTYDGDVHLLSIWNIPELENAIMLIRTLKKLRTYGAGWLYYPNKELVSLPCEICSS
jgi:aspartate/methionine/tyrosine aminotransferase